MYNKDIFNRDKILANEFIRVNLTDKFKPYNRLTGNDAVTILKHNNKYAFITVFYLLGLRVYSFKEVKTNKLYFIPIDDTYTLIINNRSI